MPDMRIRWLWTRAKEKGLYLTRWPLSGQHAKTLAIVHNRDLVMDLVTRFPSVSVLVLWHDLRLQSEPNERFSEKSSSLTTLVGSTPGLGVDHLFICPITIASLLASCPWVSHRSPPSPPTVLCSGPMRGAQRSFRAWTLRIA